MKTTWVCETCGPVTDALHGEDGQFHCSSVECDRVVNILTKSERSKAPGDWRKIGPGVGIFEGSASYGVSPKRKTAAQRDVEARKSVAYAQKVLARVSARERGGTKKKAKKSIKKKADRRKTVADRNGTCSGCNKESWLLGRDPDLCAKCYRGRNPQKKRGPSKAKRKKSEPEPIADPLDRELAAIKACGRSLEGLSPDSIERVLRWVAHRFRPELEVERLTSSARMIEVKPVDPTQKGSSGQAVDQDR